MTLAWPETEKPLCARSKRLAVLRLNTGGAGKESADTGFKGLIGCHWREVNSLCQAPRLPWGELLFVAHGRAKNFKKINRASLACRGTQYSCSQCGEEAG